MDGVVDRYCVRSAGLKFGERFRFESIRTRRGALLIRWGGRLSAATEAAVRAAVDLAKGGARALPAGGRCS